MFPDDDVDEFLQHTPGMTLGTAQHGTMHNEVSAALARLQRFLLEPNGPALTLFDATATGSYADNNALRLAWSGMTVAQASGYETYPGVQPVMGSWTDVFGTSLRWMPDEPGFYTAYVLQAVSFDGAPHATAGAGLALPLDIIGNHVWGSDSVFRKPLNPFGTYQSQRTDRVTLPISQGMIDAGFGGFDVNAPQYFTGGSERASLLYLFVLIEKYSPGSAFDYYGDL